MGEPKACFGTHIPSKFWNKLRLTILEGITVSADAVLVMPSIFLCWVFYNICFKLNIFRHVTAEGIEMCYENDNKSNDAKSIIKRALDVRWQWLSGSIKLIMLKELLKILYLVIIDSKCLLKCWQIDLRSIGKTILPEDVNKGKRDFVSGR